MAHLGDFDNYLKNSTLDLSSIESNRQEKKTETPVDNVITFTGSKLWIDIQLDAGYFLLNTSQATCLNYCFNTNFKASMSSMTDDTSRGEAMTCQYNCLQKVSNSADLLKKAIKNHPRNVRNEQEFDHINNDIQSFNDQYLNRKKDYSI